MEGASGRMTRKPCPDCKAEGRTRYASCKDGPHPAGRCHTHHKSRRRTASDARHDAIQCETYGYKPGEYKKLYDAQGGRCPVCLRARGISRRLSSDHDHKTGYLRGLLCGTCNKMYGHARDDVEFFKRAIEYLKNPPAQRILGIRIHRDHRKD